jgi:hypothetical protein
MKVNGMFVYFCVRCGEMVAWSTPDQPTEEQIREAQELIQGKPRDLTWEEKVDGK